MKRALFVVGLSLLAACRAPSPIAKQPPFDFDAAIGPGPDAYGSEADLIERWADGGTLRTFWESGESGSFAGVRGVNIAYRIHRVANPRAAVVIVPGRTEAIIKFAELASDLHAQGYSTYALTLRGQGEAGRMLPDKDKGYVEYFDDYLKDTHAFITTKVKPDNARVFMVAHSLGGAVAVLVNDTYPDDVQALALSSPMLDINLGAFPPPVAATLGEGICGVTDGTGYVLGAGDYERETDFENNSVTHSLNRWKWKIQQLDDDPSIRLGGTTWRWLCQSLDASSRAQLSGKYSSTPTLLFSASEDTIVHIKGGATYCNDAPRCTLTVLDGAKHEIFAETDALRNLTVSRIVKFFDAEVAP